MAHYAFLSGENRVVEVITGRDEDDLADGVTSWEDYYGAVKGQRCLQTSYNTRAGVHYNPETGEPSADQTKAFRKNYAGLGYLYDEERDAFIPPKPYESWVLNEDTCLWDAPLPYPVAGGPYFWNEEVEDWVDG